MKGSDVRKVREKLGLTQAGLGKVVGVHWTTVSRWEREAVNIPEPTAKLLKLLATSHTKRGR